MTNTSHSAQRPDFSPTPLTVEVFERTGAIVARLVGEIDTTTVDKAAAAVDAALDRAAAGASVVLDMTEIAFFASAGLTLLVTLKQQAQDRPIDVRLAVDATVVLRPLELMGLGDLFPIYPTLREALGAPAGQG